MRIDKFLKVSRIIKRRTVANEACDTGHISVNGKPVKASYDVKIGDRISVSFGQKTTTFEVIDLKEHVLKDAAGELYRVIGRETDA